MPKSTREDRLNERIVKLVQTLECRDKQLTEVVSSRRKLEQELNQTNLNLAELKIKYRKVLTAYCAIFKNILVQETHLHLSGIRTEITCNIYQETT